MRVGIPGHRGLPGPVEAHVRELLAAKAKEYAARDLIGMSRIADGPDAVARASPSGRP
ncbi:hypothetical protein [Streptomyces uncialis]|uniref:hypothetical protein n=1 Tax=Streptomyces uncialis TaxID=1048205 RepID=UPI00386DA812|nr:hypothetical protein OG268_13720 [Streptomyces uncialis]